MKILEVIPDLRQRAGAEVFFESLVKQLALDKDLQIVVVLIWDLIDESFLNLKYDSRIKFYCCGKTKNGIDFKSVKKFKQIVKKEDPDVIHTHRSVTLTYFLAFGFKRHNWKYIHTVHNMADKEAGKYEIFLRKRYVKKGIINQIGISDLISGTINDVYKIPASKTIYNGIVLPKPTNSSKEYDFVCTARFSKQKNHTLLLKAFSQLIKTVPNAKLLLIGTGELMKPCIEFCDKNGLSKNVIFYGHTSKAIELMDKSKVFVLSSIYEGNPISILEAMGLGLPIIAPKVGGIPDVVEDGQNGLLFEKNHETQLVECMIKLIDDNQLCKQISLNNLEKSKTFSIEHCAEQYISFFKAK